MSLASVRAFFAQHQLDLPILETEALTSTVELAALAHGVLLVASGHARIDNAKFKTAFGKGKMLPAHEVQDLTGHPVGGVCPFGLAHPLPVYLDHSLLAFDEVLPAAGSVNSAVRISPALMAQVTAGVWVDACR